MSIDKHGDELSEDYWLRRDKTTEAKLFGQKDKNKMLAYVKQVAAELKPGELLHVYNAGDAQNVCNPFGVHNTADDLIEVVRIKRWFAERRFPESWS